MTNKPQTQISPSETISIIAHRGNGPTSVLSGNGGTVPADIAPENTIKAFHKAVTEGADGIEFDVYTDKNGIPIVIHDDELNRNVEGANRKGQELGKVSEKTLAELKAYNVGQGERIPSLSETIDFIVDQNKKRATEGKPPLLMNIELKGQESWRHTSDLCRSYVDQGLIKSSDIVFCSFKRDDLSDLKKRHPDFHVAPCLKTAFLFGEENLIMPGWRLKRGATYQPSAMEDLRKFHKQHGVAGFDSILWDTYRPLLQLAKDEGVQLHVSTSDVRSFDRKHMITLLAMERTGVKINFKTDEPGKVRKELAELRNEYLAATNSTEIVSTATIDTTPETHGVNQAVPANDLARPLVRPRRSYSDLQNVHQQQMQKGQTQKQERKSRTLRVVP